MGCCSSKRAVAVGVKEDITSNGKQDKNKADGQTHITENTGISVQVTSPNATNGNKEHATLNGNGQLHKSPSVTITPKYTKSMTPSASNKALNNGHHNASKSSLVFPSSNGYQGNDSQNLLSPAQTNNVLSTTYGTDHLRASPYASSFSNRKKYSTAEKNPFRGFGTPVPGRDSDSDGFDSDIETAVNLPGMTLESVSQSLKKDDNKSTPDTSDTINDSSKIKTGERKPYSNLQDTSGTAPNTLEPEKPSTENDLNTEEEGASGKREQESAEVITDSPVAVSAQSSPTTRVKTPVKGMGAQSPKAKAKSPHASRSPSPIPSRRTRTPNLDLDPIMETLEDAFYRFARYGEVNSEGREMNNKNWAKLCRDCEFVDNKNILVGDVDVIFSRHKPKGFRLIDFDMFLKCLDEIADRKYKSNKDEKERRKKVYNNVIGKAPEYFGITSISKTGNVDRMTDHTLYPSSHKMRFDEDGRGLGVEEIFHMDPTEHGYVQGYKDKDTYNLKVSRPSSRSSLRAMSREASNLSVQSGGSPRMRRAVA